MNERLLIFLLVAIASVSVQAEESTTPSPIEFIYDSSGSMWGQIGGKAKVEIAREVMASTVANLPDGQRIGLVAYGHRSEGDCDDVETLLSDAEPAAVPAALTAIRPLGKTPLARSAMQVIGQLERSQQKATVILLTDGIESCGGDLCTVVKSARERGIEFVMHIVGFGLKPGETAPLECAAAAGGGRYYDANDAAELAAGMNEATTQTVDLPMNISVRATKNGTPLDAYITAYAAGSNNAIQNARTYHKGALFHLAPGKYDLKVSALENTDLKPIWLRNVETSAEVMTEKEVSFDAGTVRVSVLNNSQGWDSVVKISDSETVVSQARTYGRSTEMQVPPGIYSGTVQALAVEGTVTTFKLAEFEVSAGTTTEVTHTFNTGIAMIGVRIGDELVDAVVSISDRYTGKNVAGARTYTSASSNPRRFVLTPGSYSVTYSSLGKHKGHSGSFDMDIDAEGAVERVIELTTAVDER
ncbi:MAG: VWA domain-containing protein [Pseudomonadales bacterium]|nr:VWA domain-containing protein [Pseudomonadales bacterium]MCP5185096.1 VWA domain-containing protein [Pseudomonadales bacterium]